MVVPGAGSPCARGRRAAIHRLMPASDDNGFIDSATPLLERIEAVEGFAVVADRLLTVGELHVG